MRRMQKGGGGGMNEGCEKVEANFIAAHSMCGSKLTT